MNTAWDTFKKVSKALAHFQSGIILSIFYAIVLFPFSIIIRLKHDTFAQKERVSMWHEPRIKTNQPNKQY